MRSFDSIAWPPVPKAAGVPSWTGRGFRCGESIVPVLVYQGGDSGWDDDLAQLMECEASPDKPIAQASREHAIGQLRRWLPPVKSPVVLEVGCSTGAMLRAMRQAFPEAWVIGTDYALPPLHRLAAVMPDVPLARLDFADCPLPDDVADGVVALNVLEHIQDDTAALSHTYRVLKPGGIAVIEVPAMPSLYDVFDEQLRHWRRYRMSDLGRLVSAAGFEILTRSHLGFFVFPIFWLGKKRNQVLRSANDEEKRTAVLRTLRRGGDSDLLRIAFRLEALARRFVYLPVGIRCLLTCRKPG